MICWPGNLLLRVFATIISLVLFLPFFTYFLFPSLLIFKRSVWTTAQHCSYCQLPWIVLVSCCLNGMMTCWKWNSSSHVLDNLHIDFKLRYWEDSQRQDQVGTVALTRTSKSLQKIVRVEIFASVWLGGPPRHQWPLVWILGTCTYYNRKWGQYLLLFWFWFLREWIQETDRCPLEGKAIFSF